METKTGKIIAISVIVIIVILANSWLFFREKHTELPMQDLKSAVVVVGKFEDYGQYHLVVRYEMKYMIMPVRENVYTHHDVGDIIAVHDDGN